MATGSTVRRLTKMWGGCGGFLWTSYRTTLNARAKIEDDQQRDQMLKDCHKRCALRTLAVLEQNGGIFIKMGQHLVRTCTIPSCMPGAVLTLVERHELPAPLRMDVNVYSTSRPMPGVVL